MSPTSRFVLSRLLPIVLVSCSLCAPFDPAKHLARHPDLARDGGLGQIEHTVFAAVPIPRESHRESADVQLRTDEGAKSLARFHVSHYLQKSLGVPPPIQAISAVTLGFRGTDVAFAWYDAPSLPSRTFIQKIPKPPPPPPVAHAGPSRESTQPEPEPALEPEVQPASEALQPEKPRRSHSSQAGTEQAPKRETSESNANGPFKEDSDVVDPQSLKSTATSGGPEPRAAPPVDALLPENVHSPTESLDSSATSPELAEPPPPPDCDSPEFHGWYPGDASLTEARFIRVCKQPTRPDPLDQLDSLGPPGALVWGLSPDQSFLGVIDKATNQAALFRLHPTHGRCWCWMAITTDLIAPENRQLGVELRSCLREDATGHSIICVLPASSPDLLRELQAAWMHASPHYMGVNSDQTMALFIHAGLGELRVFVLVARFTDLSGREIRQYREFDHTKLTQATWIPE